jgi:hypothetical protein
MTHAGVTRNPRRSYGSMKRKGNKNKKTHFVPSDQQILICQRRIKGALTRRCKGWLTRSSCADIEKTLVGMVYSRDGALGNNPDEVCLTVKAALKQMQQGKKPLVRWKDAEEGMQLIYVPWDRTQQAPHPRVMSRIREEYAFGH